MRVYVSCLLCKRSVGKSCGGGAAAACWRSGPVRSGRCTVYYVHRMVQLAPCELLRQPVIEHRGTVLDSVCAPS